MAKQSVKNKKQKLPKDFKSLFWGYKFKALNSIDDQRIVIVNILNNGNLKHWERLVEMYGFDNLKKAVQAIPRSEFRKQVIPLIKLSFHIKHFKYATRGAQIRAEKNI